MIKRINPVYFMADTKEDLKDIKAQMGVECFVITEACEYKALSTGEWVKQTPSGTTSDCDCDLSDYAKKEDLPTWNMIEGVE